MRDFAIFFTFGVALRVCWELYKRDRDRKASR